MVVEEPPRQLAGVSRARSEQLRPQKQPSRRRYELDWLRVIIVLGAMVFHAVYEIEVYFPQARSETLTTLTQIGSAFAIQWGLPLLFLIAGASAWLSLVHRGGRQFIKERVLRLLVPFLGCVLTVIPVALYMASLISPGHHTPFVQSYLDYFRSYSQLFQGNPLDHVIALWDNLWFIFVIFLVSLLTLPLILLLRGPQGTRLISRFAAVCQIPGGTLLAGLISIACLWLLGMVMPTPAVSTLWLAALCVLSFVGGVLLYADASIAQAIARDGPAALALAALCFALDQILVINNALPLPYSGGYVVSAVLAGGFPWFGAIAFLGLAKRFFNFTNRALEYLKEAVFPYFLLHMLIFSIFGYIFLAHTHLPGVLQVAAILSCSALSLALLYEFVVKRNAYVRVIFGLKPRPRA